MKIRVLSYNIHKGFASTNRRFVLKQIKDAIQSVEADLVFLQEVVGDNHKHRQRIRDWPSSSQFEFLADQMWPHYAYGKNAVYVEGHHGNAILSKYPISSWSNADISTNPLEKRGLLHAEIHIPGSEHTLHCMCVHLNMLSRWKRAQLDKIKRRALTLIPHQAPLVFAGDFNDWGEKVTEYLALNLSAEEVFFKISGKHERTFPAIYPLLKLDRIYVRGLTPAKVEVLNGGIWSKLSDHAALFTELELNHK